MKIKQFPSISIVLMLILSLFTMACNKEKGDVTPNVLRKVDKETNSDGTFEKFTYDANSRCTKYDSKGYTAIYSYNGNTVVETELPQSGTNGIVTTCTLNAQGFVASFTFTYSNVNYLYLDEYNAGGFRTKRTAKSKPISSSSFITDFELTRTYDSDNDLITLENRGYSTGNSSYSYKYEYDKNHYDTSSNEFSGFDWFGKNAPHVKIKETYTPSTGSPAVTNYAWFYDEKGYNTRRVSSGASTITTDFTYK